MKRILGKRSEKAEAAPVSKSFLERGADWIETTLTLCRVVVFVGIIFSIYNVSSNVARKERSEEFRAAMEAGDGARAVKIAKKGVLGDNDYKLAQAYEANGDYDRAAVCLTACGGENCDDWARLDYKRGRKREAFDAWTVKAEKIVSSCYPNFRWSLKTRNETGVGTFNELEDDGKTALRATFRMDATMEREQYPKLSPFATYADFLAFMEAEFAALSKSDRAERAEAMDFIRSVATDSEVERKIRS